MRISVEESFTQDFLPVVSLQNLKMPLLLSAMVELLQFKNPTKDIFFPETGKWLKTLYHSFPPPSIN